MSRKNKKKIDIATDEEVAKFGDGKARGEAADGATEPREPAEAEPVEADFADSNDWKDKFLRAKAEMANYQRRSEKDRAEALRYANAALVRSILPVIDDLQRVIESGAHEGATAQAVADGAKMTLDNLMKHLGEFHVVKIEAGDQPFDPEVHEAMLEQPSADHSERTVLQVLAEGYRLHDRVLRPAKVIVSKAAEEGQP